MEQRTRFTVFLRVALFLLLLMSPVACNAREQNQMESIEETESISEEKSRYEGRIIVIDAGHGGADPGKVGVEGTLEKEINLAIALKVRDLLSSDGIEVIMTRTQDETPGDPNASNAKMADLNERIKIIDQSTAELTVSIHQNSFSDKSVYGPQVFYHEESEEGRKAAQMLQNALDETLNVKKKREIKANDSYYLLKKSKKVVVIAECAFLSNPEEEKLLRDEKYQELLAQAIRKGVLDYLDACDDSGLSILKEM